MPPRGYLLVWADGETGQNSTNRPDLHASFKLSKQGDAIGIFAADGTVIDFVWFGPQVTDVSEGRFHDGSPSIYSLTTPTPRAVNFLDTSNTPPVLGSIADQIVIEGQLLVLNVTASDTDLPPQQLTFTLDAGAPTGSAIDPATGIFTWIPAENQGPSTNLVTIRVTDNGPPALSDFETITIIVTEVNSVPILAPIGGKQ